ncbi:MAG TPA: HEPN domain-containing protein [Terriglobales bacterium]|nr:HEPN domain-containing protein [Terriglobales bacterium]
MPFKKLLEYVTDVANLISLGVGEPLRPREMSATCNAQDPSGARRLESVDLIHNRKPLAPVSREVPYFEMLFTLPDVRDRFEHLIAAWLGRDDAFRSLCALYFGTMRSPFMYVEHRFLNMFQALESFDRRTSTLPAEKMQKHGERLTRILNSVSDAKDRKWLENALRHSHEPAAADRIKHIVETLNASWLLSPKGIELSADYRNYYTHFDPKTEAKLPPVEERVLAMHNLAVRLRVLCELVLLNAVGFPMAKVRERLKETRRLERHLSSAACPE